MNIRLNVLTEGKKYCTYVIIDMETVNDSVSRAALERGKSKGEIC